MMSHDYLIKIYFHCVKAFDWIGEAFFNDYNIAPLITSQILKVFLLAE